MNDTPAIADSAAEAAAVFLATFDDYRVLRRVSSPAALVFSTAPNLPVTRVAVVDVETTGRDPDRDEVIDLAVLVVDIDASGRLADIVTGGAGLRDPHRPIPSEITALTGISDADVAGKAIDLDKVEAVISGAEVIVAHNAAFDFAFLTHLMPGLASMPVACSLADIDWATHGFEGRALGHLLAQGGLFHTGHRAMADVKALIALLVQHEATDGRRLFAHLLAGARQTTRMIDAVGAGYGSRAQLKGRGYRWDPMARVWWTQCRAEDEEAELAWLVREVGLHPAAIACRDVTWTDRHRPRRRS